MTPWRVHGEEEPESTKGRRLRDAFAALLVGVAIVSLFFSPMAWPLLLIYACLGLLVGLIPEGYQLLGLLGVIGLIWALNAGPGWLDHLAPHWYAAWWQPGLVALAGAGLARLMAPLVLRRMQGQR